MLSNERAHRKIGHLELEQVLYKQSHFSETNQHEFLLNGIMIEVSIKYCNLQYLLKYCLFYSLLCFYMYVSEHTKIKCKQLLWKPQSKETGDTMCSMELTFTKWYILCLFMPIIYKNLLSPIVFISSVK